MNEQMNKKKKMILGLLPVLVLGPMMMTTPSAFAQLPPVPTPEAQEGQQGQEGRLPTPTFAPPEEQELTAPIGAPAIPPEVAEVINHLRAACLEAGIEQNDCVDVDFASDSLVVLKGDRTISIMREGAIFDRTSNAFVWYTADLLKQNLGYEIQDIKLAGEGTQGNPHVWFIVMSK